ncbi:SDR family oxidoreductase [uncultured Ramlibacter sp.]|uniref:SDR family NAD(P)-dependent oxidoreductase n=1 Tax=uncultured Ramlibacter sp. TaxID=260755 RepID=UPI0026039090|nr:SDR family oxidoreductase [uncultured Ramlibacter sp.]
MRCDAAGQAGRRGPRRGWRDRRCRGTRLRREGASVYLAGRTLARLDAVADSIRAAGGTAHTAVVDALDEAAVERHAAAVAEQAGRIDIVFNAIGVFHVQGTPLAQLSLADFELPLQVYTRSNFLTTKAAAAHMVRRGSGVVLLLTTLASRMPGPGYMGHSAACAAVEGMSRHLAGELAAQGVRVACIRSHAIPQTLAADSHANAVFAQVAGPAGVSVDEMLAGAAQGTLLKRLPTLEQLAATAVFLASDEAGALTGVIVNLNGGLVLD